MIFKYSCEKSKIYFVRTISKCEKSYFTKRTFSYTVISHFSDIMNISTIYNIFITSIVLMLNSHSLHSIFLYGYNRAGKSMVGMSARKNKMQAKSRRGVSDAMNSILMYHGQYSYYSWIQTNCTHPILNNLLNKKNMYQTKKDVKSIYSNNCKRPMFLLRILWSVQTNIKK
ncbi:hypothetical protein CON35_20330 [Bacillus cereus]|nr:hypothetical protein CON35_20330 [Bacillus cereus]